MADPDRWLGLDLRHLAALRAVAEEGSFRAAAARLGYTQSAVSQQIATLERIVGATLIERRDGRPAGALTEVGRVVLQHAEGIVAHLCAAQADADAIASGAAGRLGVGTYQSVSEQMLPAVVPRFRAVHPHVALELVESESDEDPLDHIRHGELDLAFALLPLPVGPFACIELMRDPWMLLVPADCPLAQRRGPISLDDAATLALIGPRLDRCRIEPEVPPRVIALAWHRDRHQHPPAKAFRQLVVEFCAELTSNRTLVSA